MSEKKADQQGYKDWYEKNMERLLKKSRSLPVGGPDADLQREFDSFAGAPFPPAARGQEINGVDLVLLDSTAAGCIQFFASRGFLDEERMRTLKSCVEELGKIVPLLSDDSAAYFKWLLNLSVEALDRAVAAT